MNKKNGLFQLADQASALSMQLLALTGQEEWENVESIELERQKILQTLMDAMDAEEIGPEEAQALRTKIESIKMIDQKILAATEKQRTNTAGEAAKLKNANKASKLYKQHR